MQGPEATAEQIIQDTAWQYITANRKKKKTLLITGLFLNITGCI